MKVTSLPRTAAISNERDNLATSSSVPLPNESAMIVSVSDRVWPFLLLVLSSQMSLLLQSSWSLKIMSCTNRVTVLYLRLRSRTHILPDVVIVSHGDVGRHVADPVDWDAGDVPDLHQFRLPPLPGLLVS